MSEAIPRDERDMSPFKYSIVAQVPTPHSTPFPKHFCEESRIDAGTIGEAMDMALCRAVGLMKPEWMACVVRVWEHDGIGLQAELPRDKWAGSREMRLMGYKES